MMSLQERFVASLDDLDLPDTDVAALVLAELSDNARPVRSRKPVRVGTRRTLLAMAAALIVIMGISVIAPARDAVAQWFGIGSTKIDIVLPGAIDTSAPRTDGATDSPTATTTASGTSTETTPIGPHLNPSSSLDAPIAVVDDGVGLGRSYLWSATTELPSLGDDIGLILSVRQVTGALDVKRVGNDVGVEFVTIDFRDGLVVGLWIDGTHELVAAGTDRAVLAERVLLWESDGVQYRMESKLDRDGAIALASSMSGGTDLLRPG